jgi:hypothetical protein
MARSRYIIVRVDDETKTRLEQAARGRHQNLTTFVLDAAEQAARRKTTPVAIDPASRVVKPRGRGPCPSYFVCCCAEASRGGAGGYVTAGRELARHLADEAPRNYSARDWAEKLQDLKRLVGGGKDDDGVLAWFDVELPRCMKLIPRRKRPQFLQGVHASFEEDHTICQV